MQLTAAFRSICGNWIALFFNASTLRAAVIAYTSLLNPSNKVNIMVIDNILIYKQYIYCHFAFSKNFSIKFFKSFTKSSIKNYWLTIAYVVTSLDQQ